MESVLIILFIISTLILIFLVSHFEKEEQREYYKSLEKDKIILKQEEEILSLVDEINSINRNYAITKKRLDETLKIIEKQKEENND